MFQNHEDPGATVKFQELSEAYTALRIGGLLTLNPFTTIHDGNFRPDSSSYVTIHDGNFRPDSSSYVTIHDGNFRPDLSSYVTIHDRNSRPHSSSYVTIHDGNFRCHSSSYVAIHDANFALIYYSYTRNPGMHFGLKVKWLNAIHVYSYYLTLCHNNVMCPVGIKD